MKDTLVESTTTIASALFAYASVANNKLLKESSNFSHSEFNPATPSSLKSPSMLL